MSKYHRLGELLVERGHLTQEQVERAEEQQRESGGRLGDILVSARLISEDVLVECLALQFDIETVNLKQVKPEPEVLNIIDEDYAKEHLILPLKMTNQIMECVIADPLDLEATDLLARVSGKNTHYYLAPKTELLNAIRSAYAAANQSANSNIEKLLQDEPEEIQIVERPAEDIKAEVSEPVQYEPVGMAAEEPKTIPFEQEFDIQYEDVPADVESRAVETEETGIDLNEPDAVPQVDEVVAEKPEKKEKKPRKKTSKKPRKTAQKRKPKIVAQDDRDALLKGLEAIEHPVKSSKITGIIEDLKNRWKDAS